MAGTVLDDIYDCSTFEKGFLGLSLGDQIRLMDEMISEIQNAPRDRRLSMPEMERLGCLSAYVEAAFPILKLEKGTPAFTIAQRSVGFLSNFNGNRNARKWHAAIRAIAVLVSVTDEEIDRALEAIK